MIDLRLGDCIEILPTLPNNSVDAVVTDPPYYRVKGESWDRQWDNPQAFLEWMRQLCNEWHRLLKPNGSLYVFASPQMAARVECVIGEQFNVLNHITWRKPVSRHQQACKEVLRGYFPQSERIIFAEHYGADNIAKGESGYGAKCDELREFVFEPLRAYLDNERLRAGIAQREIISYLGMTGHDPHFFKPVQWKLPLPVQYMRLQQLFNDKGMTGAGPYLRREYEDLRREYEDLRREYEDLRRPFSVSADVPYTDVWDFATVKPYSGKHPCEKPQNLLRHILQRSTRDGATVLDCFMGTGSLALACRKEGRSFIGIEKDPQYFEIAKRRIDEAQQKLAAQPALLEVAR